ncbi:helix-turn-helix domain-containing protein [Methylobacterium sp. J-030]|uniref:helix-turn-helix domain-containing protein n=1 Tax=Methylobacterium sp. J-030 TaxID=2836627 RepID=UPI001FBC0A67|nr:helix-turn-helix domain-containing protein [Methylobacterium sp. J-030]MCJ2067834.1 helix-turn-helix domain-containing protein [Methylobacterium sp. J-030]
MSERSVLHREVANLRERVDVLEEEVRQLRDAFEPSAAMPEAWKLTKSEARLLHVLAHARGGYLNKERILTALYGLEPDVEIKIVDVFVCKLRRKLSAAGSAIEIKTYHGDGFGLTTEGHAAFRRETAPGGEVRVAQDAQTEAWLRERLAALETENDLLREIAGRAPAPAPVAQTRPRWSWRDHGTRDRRRRA